MKTLVFSAQGRRGQRQHSLDVGVFHFPWKLEAADVACCFISKTSYSLSFNRNERNFPIVDLIEQILQG